MVHVLDEKLIYRYGSYVSRATLNLLIQNCGGCKALHAKRALHWKLSLNQQWVQHGISGAAHKRLPMRLPSMDQQRRLITQISRCRRLHVEKQSDERKPLQYCGRLSLKTARGGESPWSIVCTR
jgi:hypothetical protein